ncbi:CidA/LrgA family protein [Ureibacillus xyleni]|nr:CidA/LrgA family protein [Ureibacillus xyleni]
MRIIRTIVQILILYIFYYMGVFIVEMTNLPLPPSIVGLLLLVGCLQLKWIKVEYIQDGAGFLIGFMTLFFIPPMLGIIDYPELLSIKGTILISAVFISTLFTIFFTGIISQKIGMKEMARKEKGERGEDAFESNHLHH